MEKTFESELIDRINLCDRAIKNYNYRLNNPEITTAEARHCNGMIKSYANDKAYYTFVSRINDVMQLDIDDAVFRRTVGTFFTELIKEVMKNVKTD